MPKHFFHASVIDGENITLEGDVAHHLIHVLRSTVGDTLTLCDGQSTDYAVVVVQIEKSRLICRIINKTPCITEPRTSVTVYQALPKADKLELVIQKSVELGAVAIVPVITSRTIIRKVDDKKTSRYQKIAEAAAGQSMRGIIPVVHTGIQFKQMLSKIEGQQTIVAYENEHNATLKSVISREKPQFLNILIGPEGGIAPNEAEMLMSIGAKLVTLGPRILRTETAAIAMLAQVMCLLEEE